MRPRCPARQDQRTSRSDEAFAGALAFDAFARQIIACRPLNRDDATAIFPRPWGDNDEIPTAEWLQLRGINIAPVVVGRAVCAVAGERRIHPVRDWLDNLRWDGTPRLEAWTSTHLGAEPTPLHHTIGALWLISAVARIFRPRGQGRPHAHPRRAARNAEVDGAQGAGGRALVHRRAARARLEGRRHPVAGCLDRRGRRARCHRPRRGVVDQALRHPHQGSLPAALRSSCRRGAATMRLRRHRQPGHLSPRRDRQPALLAGSLRHHRHRVIGAGPRPALGRGRHPLQAGCDLVDQGAGADRGRRQGRAGALPGRCLGCQDRPSAHPRAAARELGLRPASTTGARSRPRARHRSATSRSKKSSSRLSASSRHAGAGSSRCASGLLEEPRLGPLPGQDRLGTVQHP